MKISRVTGFAVCLAAALLLVLPAGAQSDRGKAELNAAGGKIVVDYGRPQLKGRDPLTWQKDGSYWRMGMNDMTTLATPADLMFGSTRLAKGTYGIWLLKVSADSYELVFNTETSGMGMSHDKAKDAASIPMKKQATSSSVENFTIELKQGPKGGTFVMTWGSINLSSEFQIGK